ncbi:hypothetical protein T12_13195, partial [Trichinella patagoniensis]
LKVAVPLAPDCFHSDCSTNNDIIDLVVFIQFYYELKITFVLCILKMRRWNLLSVKADSKTIGITSSAEFLWCSFCSGQRDKSCSHHFVLNLASQTSVSIEFAPDCSWIVQFLSLWTPCLVMFTSVCSKCGITNSALHYHQANSMFLLMAL